MAIQTFIICFPEECWKRMNHFPYKCFRCAKNRVAFMLFFLHARASPQCIAHSHSLVQCSVHAKQFSVLCVSWMACFVFLAVQILFHWHGVFPFIPTILFWIVCFGSALVEVDWKFCFLFDCNAWEILSVRLCILYAMLMISRNRISTFSCFAYTEMSKFSTFTNQMGLPSQLLE